MCGITGIYNYEKNDGIDLDLLRRMYKVIDHRGPDQSGEFVDKEMGVGLGHSRLSIIDLKTGQQPMANAAKDIWIVFNGEIYNFRELRDELKAKGCQFHSHSDTEVIIYLYEKYGERAFERLNGIFAFAIYDKRKKCMLIVRDHFGVKPLYYALQGGKLVFGSEIKSIIEDQSFKRELDFEALNSFFTFRYNPAPQTLFKGIKKLLAGHFLKIDSKKNISIESFWDYTPRTNNRIKEFDAIEEYQRLLEKAVSRQMVSDVPVGLLLSGGIDSAIIGYFMQKYSSKRIKSFTIGFPGRGDFNELNDARRTADIINSEHFDLTITQEEYLKFYYRSFQYTEEPIAEPTVPALYYVSQLASKHLKVVLGGQGADEPMAGYNRYIGAHYLCEYAHILKYLPLNLIARILPRNEKITRAAYVKQFTSELQRILGVYTIFTNEQKESLFSDNTKMQLKNVDEKLIKRLYEQTNQMEKSLSKILFMDTRMTLSDNLLLFNDKITMANSLEMRVPFLDIDLVKFLESLPAHLKLNRLKRKYIHKKAVQKWLPREIIDRKKRGFATPMDQWLQKDFAQTAYGLLTEKNSACRKYFDIGYIKKIIDQHQRRKANFQRHIFILLSFEIWHKTFFEESKPALMPQILLNKQKESS